MMRLIAKLLLLLAVMLMPFGMAPAGASPNQPHAMSAGMPMQHCPEQRGKGDMKGGFADCSMACSAALPAVDRPREGHSPIAGPPTAPAAARELHGLHPDTATPPPKAS